MEAARAPGTAKGLIEQVLTNLKQGGAGFAILREEAPALINWWRRGAPPGRYRENTFLHIFRRQTSFFFQTRATHVETEYDAHRVKCI